MKGLNQKVIIDKKLLELNSTKAKGLISGMKELYGLGYELEILGSKMKDNPVLEKIFISEGIKVSGESNNPAAFKISPNTGGTNTIRIANKGKIRNFADAVNEIKKRRRTATNRRSTNETDVNIKVSLDGTGKSKIKTGIGFFDHMLQQIARHANINLEVKVKGDLHVDEHHTVEDVGITLGSVLNEALGNKTGIKRYGFFLPMDDSSAICSIDLGGRTYLNFNCKFNREKVGEFPTELTEEFFRALASGLKANIYIKAKGKNDHHKIEAMFKAFAKSFNEACRFDERSAGKLPSTKGVL